jgi:hypothetical protein
MRGQAAMPAVLALLAGTLLAGCDELDDPSTVTDLRVLAVAADPPEVILDPGQDVTAELPAVQLALLVADPAGGGRPLTVAVRACANDPRAPSAPGAGTEASGNYPAGGARSSVGSARCPAADSATSFAVQPAAPLGTPLMFRPTRAQLAAALETDVFPGHLGRPHGGFDLGLPITLDLNVQAGGDSAAAVKRVVFWMAPVRADQRPNRNPVITEVAAFPDRDPVSLEPRGAVTPLPPGERRRVQTGSTLWLEPRGAEAEPYVTAVVDRATDEARPQEVPAETLRFSFYASAGKFVPPETLSERGFGIEGSGHVPLEARYEPPPASALPAEGALDVDVWIVVRDERGGASWVTRQLRVEATR